MEETELTAETPIKNNGVQFSVMRSKFFKRLIGIVCTSILVIGVVTMMYLFEAARIGIPIALGICAIVIGAAWGMSK